MQDGYIDIPIEAGFKFWAEGAEAARVVRTNVPHTFSNTLPFDFGYCGGAPLKLAHEMIECVLTKSRYGGKRVPAKSIHPQYTGIMFWMTWRLGHSFREKYLTTTETGGTTLTYQEVSVWVTEKVYEIEGAFR